MRTTFLILIILLITNNSYAQFNRGVNKISDGLSWGQWDGLAIMQTKAFRDDRAHLKNSHRFVQGSPYYDRTFKKSEVNYYNEVIPQDIYLRYNANTDELEMSSYQHSGETDQMLLPDVNLSARIGTETFYYFNYFANNKKEEQLKGYFIVLLKDTAYSLYLKKTKVFRKAKVAKTSLERSFPARFEEKREYYFKKDNEVLIPIKATKSSLLKNFNKNKVKRILNKIPNSLEEQQFLMRFFKEINLAY